MFTTTVILTLNLEETRFDAQAHLPWESFVQNSSSGLGNAVVVSYQLCSLSRSS